MAGNMNGGSSYFKGLTKRDYIKKTQEIILSEGREAASIRRIAKEMGCSSASLYRYFDNQAELIYYAELNQLSGYIKRLNEAEKKIHRNDLVLVVGTVLEYVVMASIAVIVISIIFV